MKILLIDDDPLVCELLQQDLKELGHTVIQAQNGAVGAALLECENPDAIILDIIMPVQEGIESIIQFRKTHPRLPIIAISGGGKSVDNSYLETAKLLGANFALRKPITRKELENTIELIETTSVAHSTD